MSVSSLGYLGFEVSDIEAWRRFMVDGVGAIVTNNDSGFSAQIDEYQQRLFFREGSLDDLAIAGFECENEDQLDETVSSLREAGYEVSGASESTRAARKVAALYELLDPEGFPLELYTTLNKSEQQFKSDLVKSGFVTGNGGASHFVLGCADSAARLEFYQNQLGFRLSDVISVKINPELTLQLTFLHVNERHHTLALAGTPMRKRIDHFMLEVGDIEDVGLAHDRMRSLNIPIARSLGQHPNDGMFSFYAETPSGFLMEFGSGGIKINDDNWQTAEYSTTSTWGHKSPGTV